MKLTSRQKELEITDDAFGELRDSTAALSDGPALRQRMTHDGYLFFRGALNRDEVIQARQECVRRLHEAGLLEPGSDPMEAIPRRSPDGSLNLYFRAELAEDNLPLLKVLYDGPMMEIFARLLDGPVLHYDFTWMRAVSPGGGTAPHCDKVYMGRGTPKLFTAWTPLGDIPISVGGLIILEGSHKRQDITGNYLAQDVDSYCENGPAAEAVQTGKIHWEHPETHEAWDGAFSHDPPALRQQLGGRWLTTNYQMGDLLIFSMAALHASLDNQGNTIRLSSDTRYQRTDEPVDERWINGADGSKPITHSLAAKRGRIC
ncbi:phytanoyl-CoA dioxygenase family protein [Armatimonas sp.]|uniref:phytanoyl-CoA dioxygenase family protein n=1 Tax=Armatimonas sp. TaxID=1872638 RepID=UPI00286A4FAC|nr:phytanoyl-CoA dioxygenase family protein [Armatimonas sp.]